MGPKSPFVWVAIVMSQNESVFRITSYKYLIILKLLKDVSSPYVENVLKNEIIA